MVALRRDGGSDEGEGGTTRAPLVPLAELLAPPEDLPVERLEFQLTSFAAAAAAAMHRVLTLVAEYDRRNAWERWEVRSCARWLELHCHISGSTAREWVRVAHALETLPLTNNEFAAGRLSYTKVRALTRLATPDSEDDLVNLAASMPTDAFWRTVRTIERSVKALSDDDHENAESKRACDRHDNGDGTITWTLRVSVDEDLTINRAVAHARDDDFDSARLDARASGAQVGVGRGNGMSRLDAVLRAFELSVGADADGLVPSPYLTMVHVHAAPEVGEDGVVTLDSGLRLHPRLARHVGCDSTVQLVFHDDDGGVRMGRRARTFTDRQRDLLAAEYQTCGFPGCDVSARRCQMHHLEHWTNGGPTDVDNGIPLCRGHHRAIHRRGWRIGRNKGHDVIAIGPEGQRAVRKVVPPTLGAAPACGALVDLVGGLVQTLKPFEQPERCGRRTTDDIISNCLANHEIGTFRIASDNDASSEEASTGRASADPPSD